MVFTRTQKRKIDDLQQSNTISENLEVQDDFSNVRLTKKKRTKKLIEKTQEACVQTDTDADADADVEDCTDDSFINDKSETSENTNTEHEQDGEQNQTNESGIIEGQFTPLSAVYGFNYARKVNKYNLGLDVKLITHNLHTQSAKGLVFGVGGYFPKVYKDLDLDVMVRNFGFAPKFGSWKSELPTSVNVAGTYPYKEWMFYGQFNKMKKHQTFGMGTGYNYKNMLWGKAGYYIDNMHKLTYPTFGLDFKYDKYIIGMSYIYGDKTLPLSNTIRLTINLEL